MSKDYSSYGPYLANLGLGLLGNSGYSPTPQTFGQIFAKSALSANQIEQERKENEFKNALLQMQLKKFQREMTQPISVGAGHSLVDPETFQPVYTNPKSSLGSTPAALQIADEYEAAIKSGNIERAKNILAFSKTLEKGTTFDDGGNIVAIPGATNTYSAISEAKQTGKNRSDLNFAEPTRTAEARGTARGTAQGAIDKKEINAPALQEAINQARQYLPQASSGGLQNAYTGINNFIGRSTSMQDADSQLDTIGGVLVSNVPRMEGPQSDQDRLLYQRMAGDVSNSKLPYQARLKALDTVEALNKKYLNQSQQNNFQPPIINKQKVGETSRLLNSIHNRPALDSIFKQ